MKSISRVLVLSVFYLSFGYPQSISWQQLSGAHGENIYSSAVDKDRNLYSGQTGTAGRFKSIESKNFHFDDPSLIASYPFTGNANDSSGYDNNGSVINAILTTDRFGAENSAYEFNGSSSYITVPNSLSLQSPDTELTQNAWMYAYSWSSGNDWAPLLMKSNSGDNAFQYRLSVGFTSINTAINNWGNAFLTHDTLEFNRWYMITSVLKGDSVKHYVNGKFAGSGTLAGPIMSDTKPLEIGRDLPGATEYFHGKIDDIRIYNRAITPFEVESLYGDVVSVESDINSNMPEKLELEQNYPNPFNNSTLIKYSIPDGGLVTLKIFNILGQEVAVLVNETKQIGNYQVTFDTGDLTSGVYVYKLSSQGFSRTKKMMLLR